VGGVTCSSRAREKELRPLRARGRKGDSARKTDANYDTRAHLYALGEEICQVGKNSKLGCQIVGGQFFLFYQKNVDAKLIWQTLGDSGHEPWLYSYRATP